MKNFPVVLLLILIAGCLGENSHPFREESYHFMKQGFQSPPAYTHPIVYHWWLGGYVDTLRLKEEIMSLKNAGISGFTIVEIGSRDTAFVKQGPAFLSDKS